jgi:hypothetical protein
MPVTQVALDTGFGEMILAHQRGDARPVAASLPEGCALLWRQALFSAHVHPTCSGLLDPIPLPLGPEFGRELRHGTQHVEQQAAGRSTGVEMLIAHLKVDLLARQFGGNLAQMQRGAGEPVQARHHEGVAFPHLFQARLSSGPFPRRAADCWARQPIVSNWATRTIDAP